MKMLTKVQLLVHLKCVEDTLRMMQTGNYRYGSSSCAFCRAFETSCKACTWLVIQGRHCTKAYTNWRYIWKPYRWVTLQWWQYKIKRRLYELES